MTNGEVFQKIFPCEEIHINGLQDGMVHFSMKSNLKSMDCFSLEWWNGEYNGPFAVPGEWIPVSERLPEKDMLCLVAVGLLNLTQLAMYSDLMGVIDHRIFYQGDVGHDSFEDITEYVKAWIPLPEPYKAESEE